MVNELNTSYMTTSTRPSRNLSHVTFSSKVNSSGSGNIGSGSSSQTIANNIHLSVTGHTGAHGTGNVGEETVTGKNLGWLARTRGRSAELPVKSANEYIWKKLEAIVERMQDDGGSASNSGGSNNMPGSSSSGTGVPIRTVKSLMSTVPSVFTGSDLILWVMRHLRADDPTEAAHLASMISSMGFLFPIADHLLTVRHDAHALYRFQTPCLYPGRCVEADNIEYAVYLCKRTMQNKQRLELADFEAERLATLQSFYWHKWEFIYLQAEAEAKVDKKRDKVERLVLESQEKGFWDAARPVAGAVNNNDIDMRKLCRAKRPKKTGGKPVWLPLPTGVAGEVLWSALDCISANESLTKLRACAERKRVRISKAAESVQSYNELYVEYDLLLSSSAAGSGGGGGGDSGTSNAPATASFTVLDDGGAGTSGAGNGQTASSSNNYMSSSININSNSSSNMAGQIAAAAAAGSSSSAAAAIIASSAADPNGSGVMSTSITGGSCSNAADFSAINPWITDSPEFWVQETTLKDVSSRRVRRWGFSIQELLKDLAGHEEIQKWLEKEFSAENLKFWEACQELKAGPLKEVTRRVDEIYTQFLSPNAAEPLNVDSRVAESVRQRISRWGAGSAASSNSNNNTNTSVSNNSCSDRRYCFEEAEEHIFKLMTSDSYYRFLRSNIYKELAAGQKKKSKRKFPADIRQRLEIE